MKTNLALAACIYLTASLPGFSDTFKLKDGTTLEGKIIRETPEDYMLEVQVTKSIKDERKVSKADVVKYTRDQPDLKAFVSLQKLVPTPDYLTAALYAADIAGVEKFLKTYSASPKAKDAKVILETLKKEQALVTAGGMKVGGKMIAPEEYKANAYELDARVQEMAIRSLIASEKSLSSLRLFAEFDRDYPTTLAHGALAAGIMEVIVSYTAEAKESLSTLAARLVERDSGLRQMAEEDRGATKAAIEEEDAEAEAIYQAEKKASQHWVSTSLFHKASLEEAVKFGEAEIARLSKTTAVPGVEGGNCYRELYSAVNGGGSLAAVTTAVTAAKAALVPPRYLAPLEAAAKDRK
jgi:hypothetical protein